MRANPQVRGDFILKVNFSAFQVPSAATNKPTAPKIGRMGKIVTVALVRSHDQLWEGLRGIIAKLREVFSVYQKTELTGLSLGSRETP